MGDDSLYLSPHLDDAVLSCAGHILHERDQGRRVFVATLFSRGGDDEASQTLYRTRRDEDRRALALLGAEALHLGLLDAPFRDPYYRSFQPLLLGEHERDAGDEEETARVLVDLWRRLAPARVYCPLGVGTHIDHRLTFRAARQLPTPLIYYEDRPYALIREQVEMRLAELGIRREDAVDAATASLEQRQERFRESFRRAGYVRAYLDPGPTWRNCERILIAKLRHPAPADGPRFRPETTWLDLDRFAIVRDAVFAYATQTPDLFGTVESYCLDTLRYSAELGAANLYGERRWSDVGGGNAESA